MNQNEFKEIRDFIENKSVQLMYHEGRSFTKSGFDISNFFEKEIGGRKFIILSTKVFNHVLESVLIDACILYPHYFGNDDAYSVIKALYQIEGFGNEAQFSEFLKIEQFAWIIELINGHVNSKILRVELYQKIDKLKQKDNKTEFTGGVLHSFKHFTYKGIPLSTKSEKKDLDHPKSILDMLIYGFFFANLIPISNCKFESKIVVENGSIICFSFYKETVTDIYFVNSIIYKNT